MTLPCVIDPERLAAEMREHRVLVVDCRFDLSDPARGARDYAAGHIPGAVYADLNRDLSDLSRTADGRHPLPAAEDFAGVLGRWGWRPGTAVVAYDNASGALAASRLWWMLRAFGVHEAAVLDGGLGAWTAAGHSPSNEKVQPEPSDVGGTFDAQSMVDSATLLEALDEPQMLLLDARAAPRFRGDVEPLDPVAGHVPGARNRPFSENLREDGRFKSAAKLRGEFGDLLGGHAPADVVHMCGSGVTACHNLLAMEYAGLDRSRLYAPSWSGWITDPSRPVAIGAD